MSIDNGGDTAWQPTRTTSDDNPAEQGWQSTRAQTALATQIMQEPDDRVGGGSRDIGRSTGNNEYELFVSCDAAQAMQQQFEHLNPEFIVVHDIGTSTSLKLLAGIASATGRAVQKLVIRRQGYGNALAALEFVELPVPDGAPVRMYSTDADADSASRHALVRTLLSFSRLGVLMVGDLPAHAMATALKPVHDDMISGSWLNRDMLLLPLASASTLATQGVELARGTRVNVRTTPQVARPADAWGFINASWNRLREQDPAPQRPAAPVRATTPPATPPSRDAWQPTQVMTSAPAAPARSVAPIVPLTLRPMPEVATPASRAAMTTVAGPARIERYVKQLSELNGMVSCCVFDIASGRAIAHAGASPGADELATHGAELMAALTTSSRTLGLGHGAPEAAITLGTHHLLLRPVPKHPGLALHAVLDKTHANLTLARLQIQRMDALFDEPA